MRERRGGLVGAVMAGGGSRRFGSDKAAAELGGATFLDRVVTALRAVVGEVAVVRGHEPPVERAGPAAPAADASGVAAALPPGTVLLRDAVPDAGPLEGLRVALEWAEGSGADGVAVLACDLPLVDAGAIEALGRAWAERPAEAPHGVVPVVDGLPQPLAGVYAVTALPGVRSRLASSQGSSRSLQRLLGDLRMHRVPVGRGGIPRWRFLNVNTPEDHDRARELLQRAGGVPDAAATSSTSGGSGIAATGEGALRPPGAGRP